MSAEWWQPSHRFDARAVPIADRHYNRQTIGAPQFAPPGGLFVLRHEGDALWCSSWPLAEFTKHRWAGAWVNSLFRNEGERLSSELIVEAVALTRGYWPDVPSLGMVTFINAAKVRSSNPGYCYLKAGFHRHGFTKGGLHALVLDPADMPAPVLSRPLQLAFAT